MGTILVLGANGFIGSSLVSRLLKEHQVIGYDAPHTKALFDCDNYHHIAGDYCNEPDFSGILRRYGVTAIYHLICTTTPKEGTAHIESEIEQNVLPTIRLLNAAVACRVERVIFPSSGGTVYGEGEWGRGHRESETLNPICSYGVQKMTVEGYLRLYHHMHGLRTIVARIANPYGHCAQLGRTQGIIPILMRKLIAGEAIDLYGETERDYLYIDDAVRALVSLLDYQGSETLFNIGSGKGVSLHELVSRIESVVGRRFAAVNQKEIRLCDVYSNVLDISKAERELGWRPEVLLDEGIQKTYFAM